MKSTLYAVRRRDGQWYQFRCPDRPRHGWVAEFTHRCLTDDAVLVERLARYYAADDAVPVAFSLILITPSAETEAA